MGVSNYRNHLFFCEDCKHEFEEYMWTKDGEPAGVNCEKCKTKLMPINRPSKVAPHVIKEDWTKKVPTGWSDFLGEFSKRHSKNGATINTHKRGSWS